jgi:hypothetical protein
MALKLAALTTIVAGTLVAILLPTGSNSSAEAAQFLRCVANPVTVAAIGSGTWGTSDRVKNEAIASWQAAASQAVGPNYANFSRSVGADVDCHRQMFKVTCVATATPCRS